MNTKILIKNILNERAQYEDDRIEAMDELLNAFNRVDEAWVDGTDEGMVFLTDYPFRDDWESMMSSIKYWRKSVVAKVRSEY